MSTENAPPVAVDQGEAGVPRAAIIAPPTLGSPNDDDEKEGTPSEEGGSEIEGQELGNGKHDFVR